MDPVRKPIPTEQSAEAAQPSLEIVPSAPPDPNRPPEQLPLVRMLRLVESIHAQQRDLAAGLRDIKASLPMQRRPVSKRVQSIHITATLVKRAGLCPCCQEARIVDDRGRLPGAEFDHWYSRDKNRAHQVWLVCAACNGALVNTEFKAAARSAFESYQAALRPLLSRQVPLGLTAVPKDK